MIAMVEQRLDDRLIAPAIGWRKNTAADLVEHLLQFRIRVVDCAGLISAGPRASDACRVESEDEHVVRTDRIANLDVRAVLGPQRDGAVERELHVAGAGRFGAGG